MNFCTTAPLSLYVNVRAVARQSLSYLSMLIWHPHCAACESWCRSLTHHCPNVFIEAVNESMSKFYPVCSNSFSSEQGFRSISALSFQWQKDWFLHFFFSNLKASFIFLFLLKQMKKAHASVMIRGLSSFYFFVMDSGLSQPPSITITPDFTLKRSPSYFLTWRVIP